MSIAAEPWETPRPSETALIVAVPEAEPVVSVHRRRLDTAASWGVPAHVTILYPFLEPELLAPGIVERVSRAVRSVDRFTCAFKQTRWFDRDVLWLAPDPDHPFRALTAALVAAFPTHLPYGGTFGPDATPHLTVAESGRADSIDELRETERQVRQGLPFQADVTEVLLIAGTAAPESWSVVCRLPLGGG